MAEPEKQEILPSVQSKPVQQELFPNEFTELIAVERQRLDASNKRTEVMRLMVEANDAADKRQYEFQMAQLNVRANDALGKHGLLKTVLYFGGAFLFCLVTFLVYMAFFGAGPQQEVALKILSILGTGLGGAGIFKLGTEAVKKMTQKSPLG